MMSSLLAAGGEGRNDGRNALLSGPLYQEPPETRRPAAGALSQHSCALPSALIGIHHSYTIIYKEYKSFTITQRFTAETRPKPTKIQYKIKQHDV